MLRYIVNLIIILTFGLFLVSCEEPDTTPPTVAIAFPANGTSVSEIVNVTCVASDNVGVEKVELWVDGVSTDETDQSEPYSMVWNTTEQVDGSLHVLTIRAYDAEGNTTDSDPVTITIDQTDAYPQAVDVKSIEYDTVSMIISWSESAETDFLRYELLSSINATDFGKIAEVHDQGQSTHSISEFDPTIENYFKVVVVDVYGLSTQGASMNNPPDPPPAIASIHPLVFGEETLTIKWSKNKEADFESYTLYASDAEDMSNSTELYSTTSAGDTAFTVESAGQDIIYYQVLTKDFWEQSSASEIVVSSVVAPMVGEWQLVDMIQSTSYYLADSTLTEMGYPYGSVLTQGTGDWSYFSSLGVQLTILLNADQTFELAGNLPYPAAILGEPHQLVSIVDAGAWDVNPDFTTILIDGAIYDIEGTLTLDDPYAPTHLEIRYGTDITSLETVSGLPWQIYIRDVTDMFMAFEKSP